MNREKSLTYIHNLIKKLYYLTFDFDFKELCIEKKKKKKKGKKLKIGNSEK